jgi:diguanylate cyclase (GGDEF)-like protein/PAS domain S-box-containing protein
MQSVTIQLQDSTKEKADSLASELGTTSNDFIIKVLELFLENTKSFSPHDISIMLEHDTYESLSSSWWYRELAENSAVMIWASGPDKGCKFFNKAWLDYTGRPVASLLGNGWASDIHPDDAKRCLQTYHSAFDKRECFDVEYRLRRHDGEYRWLIDTAVPYSNPAGVFQGYIGSCIDITPRKTMESKLNLVNKTVDLMDDGVMITGPDRIITWINPAFTRITGYTLEDVKGHKPRILSSGKHTPDFFEHMYEKLSAGERWQGEIWNRKKTGEIYPEWLSINSLQDEFGQIVNYVAIFTDITIQKAKEEHSRFLSTHDPLTGLANRYLLEHALDFAILNAKRNRKGIAVLFIDLDGFKVINDTFGHLIGDELLKDVASAITHSLRESDLATRQGGDEFVVLLENLSDANDAMEVAKKISSPVHLKIDHKAFVTFSIGISYYDGSEETNAKALIEQADLAMYQAKQSGKNTIKSKADLVLSSLPPG